MTRCLPLLLLSACATTVPFELPFAAKVGDEAFACGQEYTGLGTSNGTGTFLDARLYVHAVQLLDGEGNELRTVLDDDAWQRDGVVLLDFEDNTGGCETGSDATHTAITGEVDGRRAVRGARFRVGVPSELNHLDNATAAAPLNEPGMWWSWAGGYKYLKVDLATAVQPGFLFHLGATDCEGTPGSGFSCAWGNVAEVWMDQLELESSVIELDLAALYRDVDVMAESAEDDATPGCMSFAGDPTCPPMFGALGLGFMDEPATGVPGLFREVNP